MKDKKNKKYKSYRGAHSFFRLFAEPGFYAGITWLVLLFGCMLYPNVLPVKIAFVVLSGCWISAIVWLLRAKSARFIFTINASQYLVVGQKNTININIKCLKKNKKDWNMRIISQKEINEETFKYNKWLYNPNLIKWADRWALDNKLGFSEEDMSNAAFEDFNWNGEQNVSIEVFGRSRGLSKIAGVRVVRSDPLGWLNCSLFFPFDHAQTIYVLPQSIKQEYWPSYKARSALNKKEMKSKKLLSNGEELLGLREARDNDPLKDTHWKSYAKTGKRWVFEKEEMQQSKASILIDTSLYDSKNLEAFELLMENVAGQVFSTSMRKEIEWIFIDNEGIQANGTGNSAWNKVMEKLASIKPTSYEETENQWLRMDNHWKKVAALKVFTTRTEKELSQWVSNWKKWGISVEIITIKGGINEK